MTAIPAEIKSARCNTFVARLLKFGFSPDEVSSIFSVCQSRDRFVDFYGSPHAVALISTIVGSSLVALVCRLSLTSQSEPVGQPDLACKLASQLQPAGQPEPDNQSLPARASKPASQGKCARASQPSSQRKPETQRNQQHQCSINH